MRKFGMTAVAAVALFASVGVGGALAQTADLDCPDFDSQADAQEWLRDDPSDPDGLDADNDGVACETTPYDDPARDENPVNRSGGTTATTVASQPTAATPTTLAASGVLLQDDSFTVTGSRVGSTNVTRARSASSLPATGSNEYLAIVGAGAVVALGAGVRMRGRRAEGNHFA